MYIKADVEEILCLSLILLFTPPALSEVDDIAGLAVGCSSYMEGLASGSTNKINVSPERMRWQESECWYPHGLLPWSGSLLVDFSWAPTKTWRKFFCGW